MDRLQAIQSFIAVVEAGSFVAAAEALGQSKAAVSRHVQELEARILEARKYQEPPVPAPAGR